VSSRNSAEFSFKTGDGDFSSFPPLIKGQNLAYLRVILRQGLGLRVLLRGFRACSESPHMTNRRSALSITHK
jgi:hypothetical protein